MKKIIAVLLALVITTFAVMPAFAASSGTGEYRIAVDSTLNVRSDASTDSTKIGTLRSGEIVKVTEIKNTNWGKISYNGKTAWICLDYAVKYDPSNPSGSVDIFAKLNELRKKFPNGKYWNHMGSSTANPNGWTDTPCPSGHYLNGKQMCNGQCDGFARKLGLDIFGYSTYDKSHWTTRYDLTNLCYGDLIRYNGKHTIMVIGRKSSDVLIIADCNWDYHCGIRWDAEFSISRYIRTVNWVLHENSNNYLLSGNYSTTTTTTTTTAPTTTTTAAPTTTTTTTAAPTTTTTAKPTTTTTARRSVDGVVLDTDFALMNIGDIRTLDAKVVGSGSLTWASSSSSVASVDKNGTITAKRAGQTVITATTGSAIASCTVKVSDTPFVRLGGSSRVATAGLIADYGWNGTGARNVVLVNANSYADALAGVPLAGALSAPILLTANGKSGLEADVQETISDLGARNIYILGGTGVVSSAIESSLAKAGCTVERISGSNRASTAAAIARKLSAVTGKTPSEVFFACSTNYPDALAVSSVAAINGSPILYAPTGSKLDDDTASVLKALDPAIVTVLGGTSAVSDSAYNAIAKAGSGAICRISGSDRFATALAICSEYDDVFEGTAIAVTTGYSYPDALAGGALAAAKGIPVILADTKNGISSAMSSYLDSRSVRSVYVFGGQGAVSDRILSDYLA